MTSTSPGQGVPRKKATAKPVHPRTERPRRGGRYIRDPKTGKLTRQQPEVAPPAADSADEQDPSTGSGQEA